MASELHMWLNGQVIPNRQATISLFDRGFRLGDGAYESIRTANGKPFKVREHAQRLLRSCRFLRIDPGLTEEGLIEIGSHVCRLNAELLGPDDDYWLEYNVSRSGRPTSGVSPAETVAIFCHPLKFEAYNTHYVLGRSVFTPWVRQIPNSSGQPKIKSLSLLHFVLAQLEVYQVDEMASALLLDIQGNVAEIDGGNFMIARDGRLTLPPVDGTLEGITRATTIELAQKLGIQVREANLQLYDVINADEALATTTSYCVVPVTRVNGVWIGNGAPGPMWKQLIGAWSELLELDVVAQAVAHLSLQELKELERQVKINQSLARPGAPLAKGNATQTPMEALDD